MLGMRIKGGRHRTLVEVDILGIANHSDDFDILPGRTVANRERAADRRSPGKISRGHGLIDYRDLRKFAASSA